MKLVLHICNQNSDHRVDIEVPDFVHPRVREKGGIPCTTDGCGGTMYPVDSNNSRVFVHDIDPRKR